MKRRYVILPILTLALILVFSLIPVSFISADTNLAKNSSFSSDLDNWQNSGLVTNVAIDIIGGDYGKVLHVKGDDTYGNGDYEYWEGVWQDIHTSNKDLRFSLDWNIFSYSSNSEDGSINCGYFLLDDSYNLIGQANYSWQESPGWHHDSETIKNMWADTHGGANLIDFDYIEIYVGTWYIADAYFDNVKLTYPEAAKKKADTETNSGFVTLLYNNILGRDPDPAGLANQIAALEAGKSRMDLVYNFIFSEECQNKISGYSNEEFIEFLYQAIFDRDADSGGLANWLAEMNAGMTRADVVNAFIHSEEFTFLYL
jgi:hypothetical protein